MSMFVWVVLTFAVLLDTILRRIKVKRLVGLFSKDISLFYNELNKKSTSFLLPKYNLEYFRLNYFLVKEDKVKAGEQFDRLFCMRKTKLQEKDLLIKALGFYLNQKDKIKCKECREKVQKLKDEKILKMTDLLIDVYLNNKLEKKAELDLLLNEQPYFGV